MTPHRLAPALLLVAALLGPAPASACGGFFCQLLPIDQAGEQIVFRQEGERISAMVRILYQGEAEDFSWVVPVPPGPEIALGADRTFDALDLATRPRFELERVGEECPFDGTTTGGGDFAAEGSSGDGGVTIEQQLALGPFDVTVVGSADPEAMSTWLVDNGYDLSERGRELIAPYVEAGMEFVAVKLRSGESAGTIQPLVMRYASEKPMIPIRLTAVAAQPDMGVLVWVVGDARAVPENYLHVTPNYARLNWYTGSQNAYASYQALVTAAMNEVEEIGETDDGQGFATDFAGRIDAEIVAALPTADALRAELAALDARGGDAADFIAAAVSETFADPSGRLAVLAGALPAPSGRGPEIYLDAQTLRENYPANELDAARTTLRDAIDEREIEPFDTALALLPENAYMTRLYTTLSAEEMTVDPTFVYNAAMPDQPMTRRARLDIACGDDGTEWTLTLVEGTDRDGETVIRANQPVPFSTPAAVTAQPAAVVQARTSADAAPEVLRSATLGRLDIAADGSASEGTGPLAMGDDDDDDGFLGPVWPGALAALALLALGRRRVIALERRSGS